MRKSALLPTALSVLGLLCSSVVPGQERYPEPLPNADIGQIRKTTAVSGHDMEYDPLVGDIINHVNLDSLIANVRILSGEDSTWLNGSKVRIQHRVSNLGNDLAADYIKNQLERLENLEVYDQTYSEGGRNIYAIQPGILYPEEHYILCAHYDAVDDYCADDNASGVAAVLEAARLLSQYCLKYTLVYALWDDEEIGKTGSGYYSDRARANNKEILGVLNMDMIGWDSDKDRLVEIHSNDIAHSDSLDHLLLINNSDYGINLNPEIHCPGTWRSDHFSFWKNGYGAVMLSEAYYGEDMNPYYHTAEDRIDKFDLPYFHDLSKLAIGSISSMVQFVEDTLIVVMGPAKGYQKYAAEIMIRGVHTSFLDNNETINVWISDDSENIAADRIFVHNNSLLEAYFDIPQEATTGLWDVNVQTSMEGLLKVENGFEILPSPPIISFTPDTLRVSIQPGTSTSSQLTIKNIGDNVLNFNILSPISPGQNNAIIFDGIDDFVLIGSNSKLDITGDITISVWYKTESTKWGVLVANYDQFGPDNGYQLCSSSLDETGGFVYFECTYNNDRDCISTNASFNDGEWHFVTAIYTPDGSCRGRVFVDALEQTGYFGEYSVPIPAIGATPKYPLKFGASSDATGPEADSYFKGTLDEVRIWDKALTKEDIQANMYKNLTGYEDGLIGYWNFNEVSTDSVFDLTCHRIHGILYGVKRVQDGAPIVVIEWLSIELDSGHCMAQTSIDMEILIDAGELKEGEFQGQIIIGSNDPFHPIVKIPVILSVSHTAGTVETPDYNGISLYPNPVVDVLSIDSKYSGEHTAEIFSVNGQLLFNHVIEGPRSQIDLSCLKEGVYYIRFLSSEHVITKKLIKL